MTKPEQIELCQSAGDLLSESLAEEAVDRTKVDEAIDKLFALAASLIEQAAVEEIESW